MTTLDLSHQLQNAQISKSRLADETTARSLNILSFDVEEYFQVEAAANCISRDSWPTMEKRLPASIDSILELLTDYGIIATFFVLGWVAKHEPEVVKKIAKHGHEIASHGMSHKMVNKLSKAEFRRELSVSKKILEDLCGKQVRGFRAPTFSINHETAWALDELMETGYKYDCSVFPIHHDKYGVPDAPTQPHLARGLNGQTILEIPPLTFRALGQNWPVGGGGYFRLLPRLLLEAAISNAQNSNNCVMLYLHPWEFDPDQPVMEMPLVTRWRHRVHLDQTKDKLRFLLDQFRFSSVANSIELIEGYLKIFRYGPRDG